MGYTLDRLDPGSVDEVAQFRPELRGAVQADVAVLLT